MSEGRACVSDDGGFRAAHAAGEDWARVAKACADALGEVPEEATLGFLYATDSLADDLGSILTFLRERTRVEQWLGTVGMGVAGSGAEYYDRPALSVLVGCLPQDSFRMLPGLADPGAGIGDEVRGWISNHTPLFGVVHADPRNESIPRIVDALSTTTASFLVGGLSASRGALPQVANRVLEGGLSGALFSSDLAVATALTQGCTPIGPVREITEAEHNVIKEVDGRPALEVFKEDIGELLARDLNRITGYIYVAFPIAGTDTGDYLVRNLMSLDPSRQWIAVGELVEAGRPVMFCRRDHDAARQDLKRMLDELKGRIDGPPRAALYHSCIARGENLFGGDSEELKMIREALGDLPLAGFYANGEISNNRLYGYTGVLSVFL